MARTPSMLVAVLLATLFGSAVRADVLSQGSEFPVNDITAGTQQQPAVASDADGRFVVVWMDGYYGPGDGSGTGSPFSSSQFCMRAISSCWATTIRSANRRRSAPAPCVGAHFAMSTACA